MHTLVLHLQDITDCLCSGDPVIRKCKNLIQEQKIAFLRCDHFARKVIATQECDFLLLDEILALPDYGITTAEAIGDILKMKDESMHILLTGRTLPDSLRKYADSITTLTTEIV